VRVFEVCGPCESRSRSEMLRLNGLSLARDRSNTKTPGTSYTCSLCSTVRFDEQPMLAHKHMPKFDNQDNQTALCPA
jgi:hypothetical protein